MAQVAHHSAALWPSAISGPRAVNGMAKGITEGLYKQPAKTDKSAAARSTRVWLNFARILVQARYSPIKRKPKGKNGVFKLSIGGNMPNPAH